MRLEKAINPLLDDNDQVALSYIFEKIVTAMKAQEAVSDFFFFNLKLNGLFKYNESIHETCNTEAMSWKICSFYIYIFYFILT